MQRKINPSNTSSTGKIGELAAANFLTSKGYEILVMNFKNTHGRAVGEIDIIARDMNKNELVFVEVKNRDYKKYKDTLPEENIGYQKIRKLAKIASIYLRKMNWDDQPHRFDAISVWLNWETRIAKIKHIDNIYL